MAERHGMEMHVWMPKPLFETLVTADVLAADVKTFAVNQWGIQGFGIEKSLLQGRRPDLPEVTEEVCLRLKADVDAAAGTPLATDLVQVAPVAVPPNPIPQGRGAIDFRVTSGQGF